jgi:hypothetical protein
MKLLCRISGHKYRLARLGSITSIYLQGVPQGTSMQLHHGYKCLRCSHWRGSNTGIDYSNERYDT